MPTEGTQLTFDNPMSAVIVVVVLVALAVMVVISMRSYRGLSRRFRILPAAIRIVAAALMALSFMQPTVKRTTTEVERGQAIVLLDNSASMSVADLERGERRFDRAKWVLSEVGANLLTLIAARAEVSLYTFADEPTRVAEGNLDDLTVADGQATGIALALKRSVYAAQGRSVSGVVLLTDGRDNGSEDAVQAARGLGVPVFPVAIGTLKGPDYKDLAISEVKCEDTVAIDSVVVVEVTVKSSKYRGVVPVSLKLKDREVTSALLNLTEEDRSKKVQLKFLADRPGRFVYRVSVPLDPDERIKENNSRFFTVEVVEQTINVLYIEGAMRWEYKFLRRALDGDRDVHLDSYLRLAGNRFYRQTKPRPSKGKGRPIRRATPAGASGGLPLTKEELQDYHIVMLGDITADCFTSDQLTAIVELVDEHAGGVVTLGGRASFGPGGFRGTPIEKILPVTLSDEKSIQERGEFQTLPTQAGLAHPILALASSADEIRAVWAKLPKLEGCTKVGTVKPGATVLLHRIRPKALGDPMPVLAVQRYGKGKVAAVMVDTTWRWRFEAIGAGGDATAYSRFWSQMIRWLLPEGHEDPGAGQPVRVSTDKGEYLEGESARIEARVLGKSGKSCDTANVRAAITAPDGGKLYVTLKKMGGSAGRYTADFGPLRAGAYELTADALDKGLPLGNDTTSFLVGAASIELNETDLNEPLLKEIAAASGGQFHTPDDARLIARELKEIKREFMRTSQTRLWNSPWLLAAFVCLASIEWLIRRWSAEGMAR